jgi:spermidine/putrescine transport system substrate-binding protein
MPRTNDIDIRRINQLAAQRTTRRRFLGRGAVALGAVAVGPAILSACGDDDDSGTSADTSPSGSASLEGTSLSIFNWPLYIENDDPETSPTLSTFTERTGISVDYQPNIDSNEDFFTRFGPELDAGRGIGADIVVLTSWAAAQMIANGWAQTLDTANVPNASNVLSDLANPEWDTGRAYSLPYAIGQTGIGYYPEDTGGPVTSANAFFDPAFAGNVTILDEMRDAVGYAMLTLGYNPQTGTVDQAKEAIAKIGDARSAGQFRQITGNDYTEDLGAGQTWLAMAWSGDIASLSEDADGLEWVIPTEGGMRFVDNMLIPVGAENKAGAEAFMNYLYEPAVSAPLFESISYVSPVTGAVQEMSAEAQENPFLVPPASPPLYDFMTLTPEEDEELQTLFVEATQQ